MTRAKGQRDVEVGDESTAGILNAFTATVVIGDPRC